MAVNISFECARLLTLKIIFLTLGVHLVVIMSIDILFQFFCGL